MKKALKKIKSKLVRLIEKYCKKDYLNYCKGPQKLKDSKEGIIIVTNEAWYGGVPLVSLNFAKEYSKEFIVNSILLRKGPLLNEFSKYSNVQVCYTKKEVKKDLIKLMDFGYKKIIFNGVCSGTVLSIAKKMNFEIISLVHELPGVIHTLNVEKAAKAMAIFSDYIIFPSKYVKEKFENDICKVKCKSYIKHQGLYSVPNKLLEKKEAKKDLSEKYKFDINKKLFINVATINERKGFDIFAKLSSLDCNSIYLWIGDGKESKFARKVFAEIGYIPNNLIMPGYISDKEEMSKIYSGADCFVLTSREEPFGSIVLESFANNTPVVAFDNRGGYVDIVKKNVTGDLVDFLNLDKMIIALHTICKDKQKYIKMQSACRQIAINSSFEEYCAFVLNPKEKIK